MKKEDITLLAQLLTGMKDAIEKIEMGKKNNDFEQMTLGKKEILNFQKKIDVLL